VDALERGPGIARPMVMASANVPTRAKDAKVPDRDEKSDTSRVSVNVPASFRFLLRSELWCLRHLR
jgi:hypothetical protein